MGILISKFNNQNIETCIQAFEKRYAITLPEPYGNFLLKYNGGETPETKFRIKGVSSDLRGFYGLGRADTYHNFYSLERNGILAELLKDNMLPIADNMFGDYIVMGVGAECLGRIYFYYHDKSKKYIELTESFESFISKCKSEKIGYIPTIEERKELMRKLGKGNKITPQKIAGWQAEINEYKNIHQEKLILDSSGAGKRRTAASNTASCESHTQS